MFDITPNERFAVFIDGSNFHATIKALGFDVDYDRLLKLIKQSGRLIRVYYYTALPDDTDYAPIRPLTDWLDYNGYTVVTKLTREFTDAETGRKRIKGNMDMELALDMLKLAPHLDHAVLFSGDGDFCRLLKEVQGIGVRVTVVSSVKTQPPLIADVLRRQADDFVDVQEIKDQISRKPRPGDGAGSRQERHQDTDGDTVSDYGEAEIIQDKRPSRY